MSSTAVASRAIAANLDGEFLFILLLGQASVDMCRLTLLHAHSYLSRRNIGHCAPDGSSQVTPTVVAAAHAPILVVPSSQEVGCSIFFPFWFRAGGAR